MHFSSMVEKVIDSIIPTALTNLADEECCHFHPLDDTMFFGSLERIKKYKVTQVCVGSYF